MRYRHLLSTAGLIAAAVTLAWYANLPRPSSSIPPARVSVVRAAARPSAPASPIAHAARIARRADGDPPPTLFSRQRSDRNILSTDAQGRELAVDRDKERRDDRWATAAEHDVRDVLRATPYLDLGEGSYVSCLSSTCQVGVDSLRNMTTANINIMLARLQGSDTRSELRRLGLTPLAMIFHANDRNTRTILLLKRS